MFKKWMNEFKTFALRGNVLDLAVGVIIGGAFQGVIKSLTEDIISPIIGIFMNESFASWKLVITEQVSIAYGSFLNTVINFIIMAFVVFVLVKTMNKLATLGKNDATPESKTKKCPFCCTEISRKATRCPNCTSQLDGSNGKKVSG